MFVFFVLCSSLAFLFFIVLLFFFWNHLGRYSVCQKGRVESAEGRVLEYGGGVRIGGHGSYFLLFCLEKYLLQDQFYKPCKTTA